MRKHYRIHGRVQGVGFRQFTAEQAKRLGIVGWVRNSTDGSVEAEAQTDDAAVLRKFENHLRKGPPLARVIRIEMEEIPDLPEQDFVILH
ncbi:MAG: acylphosphatase [Turneriella sp.]|nr:acylphosphatase [Turneriella sp.]